MPLVVEKLTTARTAAASQTFAVAATAGNALIVGSVNFLGAAAQGGYAVTRTGDTYTVDTQGQSSGGADQGGIASAPNVAGGSVNLTASFTNGTSIETWAVEVSGTPSSGIRDAASPAVATGNSTAPLANSLSNVTADAIFFALFCNESAVSETVTKDANYTDTIAAVRMVETDGVNWAVGGQEYRIVTAVGAQTDGWTTSSSVPWGAMIAVYKQAAAAAATMPPPFPPPILTVM